MAHGFATSVTAKACTPSLTGHATKACGSRICCTAKAYSITAMEVCLPGSLIPTRGMGKVRFRLHGAIRSIQTWRLFFIRFRFCFHRSFICYISYRLHASITYFPHTRNAQAASPQRTATRNFPRAPCVRLCVTICIGMKERGKTTPSVVMVCFLT